MSANFSEIDVLLLKTIYSDDSKIIKESWNLFQTKFSLDTDITHSSYRLIVPAYLSAKKNECIIKNENKIEGIRRKNLFHNNLLLNQIKQIPKDTPFKLLGEFSSSMFLKRDLSLSQIDKLELLIEPKLVKILTQNLKELGWKNESQILQKNGMELEIKSFATKSRPTKSFNKLFYKILSKADFNGQSVTLPPKESLFFQSIINWCHPYLDNSYRVYEILEIISDSQQDLKHKNIIELAKKSGNLEILELGLNKVNNIIAKKEINNLIKLILTTNKTPLEASRKKANSTSKYLILNKWRKKYYDIAKRTNSSNTVIISLLAIISKLKNTLCKCSK